MGQIQQLSKAIWNSKNKKILYAIYQTEKINQILFWLIPHFNWLIWTILNGLIFYMTQSGLGDVLWVVNFGWEIIWWSIWGCWVPYEYMGTISRKAAIFSVMQIHPNRKVYVVVNFLSQVIFVFLLFLGTVMSANEVETKEKQKLSEIKN